MEVKIDCPCGEPYVFDIEPVDGKMPTEVFCPTCGADGTELSNQFLAEHAAADSPPPDSPPPGLRLQETAPPAPEEPPPVFSELVARENPALRENVPQTSLFLGSIGAVVAGAIGMGAWYWLIVTTGYELGIAAWAIGLFIGFVSLRLAKGGSQTLAVVAGTCALVAIIGGQFLVMKVSVDEYLPTAYDDQLEFAQSALAAKDDEELRHIVAANFSGFGIEYDASEITDEELAQFRSEDLPQLQAFVNGDPSREEFEDSLRSYYGTSDMNLAMLIETFSLFTLLWLFLGVGSAYKLARGGVD